MAADTFSAGLGFLVMGTGNDNNSWGSNANAEVFQVFEDAISGVLTSTVTGGTLDLSGSPPPAAPSQVRYSRLVFNGSLASDQTVIVPNLSKIWVIENATGGAFVLLMNAGGTNIQIPQGSIRIVRCAGANTLTRLDFNDISNVEASASPTLQGGKLLCDGSAYKRTRFPDLFLKIGTTWGLGAGGDVTTFGVPNLMDTGRFLRSSGPAAVGTYQANQNLAHTHTGQATGTTDNTLTDHTHTVSGTTGNDSPDHTHSVTLQGGTAAGFSLPTVVEGNGNAASLGYTSGGASARHAHTFSATSAGMSLNHTHTFTSAIFTTASSGGSEARPEAAVVLMGIRY